MLHRLWRLTALGLCAAALHGCALGPAISTPEAELAESAQAAGAAAEERPRFPAYSEEQTSFPWTRYRLALFLPDPEHRTLEAEPLPFPGITRLKDVEPEAADAVVDLWDRIRAGYRFPEETSPRIDAELKWYLDHPAYIYRTVERGRPYFHLIVEALEERGMPLEIAFLPIVESAFQPFAYSHGRAAGLWQFIPGTASRYGLKQTWWYDGRRDVVASTRAALDYLQYLSSLFNGDWMLALAAYNSGEGTVQRAVRSNLAKGRGTDFWSLDLPRETRAYVPKLLARARIFANPTEFGLDLPSLPDEPQVVRVATGSQIDLAKAAELAGITLEDLYRLNPAFNRWATDPDGPHELLLPVSAADRFITALAGLDETDRVSWTRHQIRKGETLGEIARKYQTTVAVLRDINGISGHMIREGQSLVVPVAMRDRAAYTLSAEERQRAVQASAGTADTSTVHVVRKGDTLWDIARTHGVGVRQLAQWNAMAPGDPLRPGQRLVIRKSSVTAVAGPAQKHPLSAETTQRISYVVRKGDSLSRISQRFNVKVSELLRWNSLDRNAYLQPGQRLTLYVDVTRQIANL
jgi:membrane-bound lytic murein transglycosylase D